MTAAVCRERGCTGDPPATHRAGPNHRPYSDPQPPACMLRPPPPPLLLLLLSPSSLVRLGDGNGDVGDVIAVMVDGVGDVYGDDDDDGALW